MAEMVLANAMVGSVSKDGERWVVSLESDKMNHEYFQRLARAAGLRLSEGARPEDVDPEVHAHIPLGQLAQQGKAWEQRMKVARHDYEQKKGEPVSDEEWARVSKRYVSRVNRTGLRGADRRLRTVLRVARGNFGAMEVLEDVTEDNLVRDMEEHGRTLDYYVDNLRELEGVLGKPAAFLRELAEGESEADKRMAVIEAMGKLVQSKVLADTAKSGNKLSAALNAFLDLIRSWVLQAKAMFKLGEAVNTVLTNPEAAAKMDKEFREDVERLVAQDVEFLQNIQLADGLEAMQRVYEAHDKAKADRKVKRRRRTKTPVLDAAEKKHGEQVRKEQAEKEKTQAEVQADVEAAEAAVEGDFTSSAVNEEEIFRARTGSEKFAPDARGKEPVLSVNVHAVLEDGTKATKNDLIPNENGSVFWGELPEFDELKNKGYAGLSLILRLGYKNDGFNHIVNLHGQWIMDAMGIDDPLIACKRFISTVLQSVKKINYITNGARDSLIVKSGEAERYFIVAVGKDRVDSRYAAIKTAFVASSAGRYDSDITIFGGEDALELRIPMSSFGENQRFRATSERQDRSSDYPDTAATSPSKGMMPEVGDVVKHEELISYKNKQRGGDFSASVVNQDELDAIKAATEKDGEVMSFSIADAQDSGLFEDGVMEARNAIVVAPEASFSVTALHVSPHKFRRFSTNHMGTGEGHQAFGWGLYFMTNAEVNRHYYGMFSGYEESYRLGGQAVDYYEFERKIGSILLKHGGDELYLGELRRVVVELHELPAHKLKATKLTRNRSRKYLQAYRAALKEIAELGLGVEKINKPATNYRVELNVDDSNLLMFDEAVPAELQEAVRSLEGGRSGGLVIQMPEASKETWPGYRIYNELTRKLGSAKAASEWLAERGVKGIKYLDGGSRSAGEGSYNYVIFSGDDVKITGVNETGDYKAPWEEYEDVDASFNVIGPSAKTWDKYEDSRKFKGRDDGKERVEIDAIKAAAEKNGTFMKAPNGKPSKLSEHQWLQVRTGAFKGWFGDWERAAELSFDGSEYNNETCLKMLAAEAGTPFVNDETGIEAEINNRQRGKITSGKAQRKSRESGFSTGVHNYVAAHIRRLFKHAVHIGDYRDKNQSADILAIKRFACPVRIKGVEAFAYMTVKELKQHGHKIYTLELDTIERLGGNLDEHFEEMLNPAPSKDIVARLKKLSKTYFEESSKVVDENGEPMVVYHGTPTGGFSIFRDESYFSPLMWYAEKYKNPSASSNRSSRDVGTPMLYEVFLNIRKPFDTRNAAEKKIFETDFFRKWGNGAPLSERGLPDWTDATDLLEFIEENEYDYDGLILDEGGVPDGNGGVILRGHSFVPVTPNQIKSATDNRGTFDGGNPDITFSMASVPLYHKILDTFEQRLSKDNKAVWVSRTSGNNMFTICPYPDVLNAITPWMDNVIANKDVIKKLMNKHHLLPQDVAKLPHALWNPIAVFEDPKAKQGGFIVVSDILASNNEGVMKHVMVVLELKADNHNAVITDVKSAYSADKTDKYAALLSKGYLRYADKERALLWAGAEGDSILQLLTTALLHSGSRVMLKENLQNVNTDFTSSVVNLDERALAYEVVAAGQGFRANLAFSEQIVREMRGALQRMKKLGSKTRTEREDAIAAMGTMVQVVKAAVAYLPQGYRFSVHPYLNKLEVLAELATTGDLKMTKDLANKTIKEWVKLNRGIDEVVAVKGQELDRQTSAEDLAKEYGEMQLQEAMEAIMHRVAGQLRKHAKDRAVQKIKELVERLAPKKDPKTGKLKGGKMSADAYRDLEDVATAMNMNAEELEAKLAALRAEIEKPGLSEERRAQLESEMTLYDQFGNVKDMTPEEAVAAYEALRQRVWFHRFEWDNVQAERRAARRAMVRSVVDGVGDVGQNEYNAKKRAKKPTQRLKNLADILSGMPAVLTGLRGYLPLHKLADDLARRANRAGEAIKKWEAERWVALEALSRETLGKSWRKSMDFMHEVLPTGVTFNRPKYRSVSVKTAALRELLAMTKEERRAEMNRRQKAGGLEAESVLTERDIEELEKQLLAMEEAGKVLSTVEARYVASVQREENLQLSRGEALYAILMWEQPTYTERMEAQGYTPEVIAGFKRFIGDGMLQFGYGLRELFARQGERIARVYESTFGVPFPREENYFAARWNVTGMKENPAEQLLAGMAGTPGTGNGWMKQRVKHNLELDMTKDALQVFLQATTLTDTWMATQDIVADFKAWTRDPDFDRAMTSVLGKDDYENLKDWIRIVELGGVQDCLNMGVAQDVINGLYASGAVAILGFRIQTLLRQLPSIFNGLLGAHDISAGEWLATLSRMKKAEAPMTYKRMMNSTLIQNRRQGKAGNMAGQAMRSNDTASSVSEGMLLASMLPMEWVDASCTAMSLVPVWNVYYKRAIDKGASVQEAEQAAWEQTTIVANLSSQPIGWLNKSKIAQSRNPLVKAVFYMLSENMAKFALCRALWRGGKKKAAWRAWLIYGAANAAISALLDALQGDPEEFEKGKWWEYALSVFYGPLASIPGVGEAVEALGTLLLLKVPGYVFDIDELKKAKTRASVGRAMLDVQGFIKAWTKIYGYMTDDEEHSLAEYTRAASTISRTMAIGTGWMGNALGYWSTVVAVLMNPIDFGARVWRNMKHYFD